MARPSCQQQSWAINVQSKVTYSVQTNCTHLVWIRGGKSGRQEVGNDMIGLEQPGARLSYDRPVAFQIIGEKKRKSQKKKKKEDIPMCRARPIQSARAQSYAGNEKRMFVKLGQYKGA